MIPSRPFPERTGLPAALDRRFEALIFDWDGTAVPDRRADARRARRSIERLCALGMDLAVVSGTHVGHVDGQLGARPPGPGRLYLCLNRGSEVFRVDAHGVRLLHRRTASHEEEAALTTAAQLAVARLAARGLRAEIISQRLNRRKIDLIPEPAWADPPKARIADLLAAIEERLGRNGIGGLLEVIRLATEAAADAGLADARVTSDAKHIEIGLTDKGDSARWILRELWCRGIGPGQVLVVGDEMGLLGGLPGSDSQMLVPEAARATAASVGSGAVGVSPRVIAVGGGPEAFLGILEDQLRRRERRNLPALDGDPAWTLSVLGLDPELERVHEALLTLSDGRVGTRGSPIAAHPEPAPSVLVSGLYDGEGLLAGPLWNRLAIPLAPGTLVRRLLDLRTGILGQELASSDGAARAILLSSLARPGIVIMRAVGAPALLQPGSALVPPAGSPDARIGDDGSRRWISVPAAGGGLVAAATEILLEADDAPARTLERLGVYQADPDKQPPPEAALARLAEAERAGFECLLVEHRAAWARRWEEADVAIEGDAALQRAVRFALFHLIGSVADADEAAVGARGLTGPAYRGHVFWDSDVFVLPFLAATHPDAARAMLEYRLRRLPAALAAARALGRAGARFPWESAAAGVDVTPRSARSRTGGIVPIRTGQLEEHIVADVAWAAACYLDWSGDAAFAAGPYRRLLVETARYWASRIRFDPQGRGHIYGVIGPDEYHEPVDDNAFTNVMARWNLRSAAAAAGDGADETVSEAERTRWERTADALVDGYDPKTGLYEQFEGFYGLEPLVVRDVAPRRPIAADMLLGRERVRATQVIKQADVLMLHHMIPNEIKPGSLTSNLDFYEPRTAHGSSLSPGVHAALFARAGRLGEAVEALQLASRVDLEDLTGTTAGGLHLATMGSVWQALAFGFAGLRPDGTVLRLEPRLPLAWQSLELRVRFRGSKVRVRIGPALVEIEADPPVRVRVGEGSSPVTVDSSRIRLAARGAEWTVTR